MSQYLLLFPLIFISWPALSQPIAGIETSDIDRFWLAYDRLSTARSKNDSTEIIQREYLDKATPGFRKFIKLRNFTADQYVKLIRAYPSFWKTIRPLTENIAHRKHEIDAVLDSLAGHLPGFKKPSVCFAIGNLGTGGTTTKNMILIGAEMAAADSSVVTSELRTWQKSVIGRTGDIVAMIAHEGVHTQQTGFPVLEFFSLLKNRRLRLLNMAITEGSADFITSNFLGLNINTTVHQYATPRECALWKEFEATMKSHPFDYSNWLYNGVGAKDRPADLGYFIGYKISEAFYHRAKDKDKALKTMLKRGRYKKVFKDSKYAENSCAAEHADRSWDKN